MQLDNGILNIAVSELGAELVSIEKEGHQYLWNADADYWGRHAPILFPIVGKLHEGVCHFGEQECHMKQHGFARDSRFAPTGNHGEMKLIEKPSKELYPFDFDLLVRYVLEGSQIKIIWSVVNRGKETMWFQIGAHPGFMLPQYHADDPIHGYLRLLDARGQAIRPVQHSTLEEGLRKPLPSPIPMQDSIIPITNDTFAHDALLIEEKQVTAVELLDKNQHAILRVDCPQAEAFGLWAPAKAGCPFVCLEPWCGIADAIGFSGDFSQRKYAHPLEPNATYCFTYTIDL